MTETTTIDGLRDRLAGDRAAGRRIGFVPTMGALHDGHLALIRAAARECDVVVVSVFVNPTQFDDPDDLRAYPRSLARDADAAHAAGADIVFAPDAREIYPSGFATSIHVAGVSEPWEGEHRGAGHFDGVATVVAKLLVVVAPDAAWFGAKDAQQVAVVRRLVADLHLPVSIEVLPTVRDPDGLALSSRNSRLTASDRRTALSISASLRDVARLAAAGEDDAQALSEVGRRLVADAGGVVEYWAIVHPETFERVTRIGNTVSLGIVAATVGTVRLIDNAPIVGATRGAEE